MGNQVIGARNHRNRKAGQGFTLIEFMIVMGLIAVLAAIGLPAFNERRMEGQAPEVAKALQMAITKLSNNREGGGTWVGAANGELVSLLSSDTRVQVDATNNKVYHGIGDKAGEVTFSAGTISAANDSGKIEVTKVNGAACPVLANAMKNFTKTMKVNATDVKTATAAYNGPAASTACTKGDDNTLVFQF